MDKEKISIIKRSTDEYKKLPLDKQMFVLGIMQGILLAREPNNIEKKGA